NRLMGAVKVLASSENSSSDESHTVTASSAAAAAAGPAPAAASGCPLGGGGVRALLEQQRQLNAPTDVRLSVLLGAGSFGRVYSGMWCGRPCAVKILTHGPHETPVIERELQVSLSCKHPHVVRTMDFVKLDVTGAAARLQQAKGGVRPLKGGAGGGVDGPTTTSSSGSSGVDLFPTPNENHGVAGAAAASGAVANGVYETWLIQELCDGGALSSALYGGRFLGVVHADGIIPGSAGGGGSGRNGQHVNLPAILSLALDISRGMAYLHSRGIVHGDLKAENVLLVTRGTALTSMPGDGRVAGLTEDGQDEGGCRGEGAAVRLSTAPSSGSSGTTADGGRYCRYIAKVADFGLSRALVPGRTHQTTRNVGTITHMPPESLMGGQLRLATDVYAFGVLMWELFTGSRPYSGLTAGEVVQRVVVQGFRPAFPGATPQEWRDLAGECWAQAPEERPGFEQVEQRLLTLLGGYDDTESLARQTDSFRTTSTSTAAPTVNRPVVPTAPALLPRATPVGGDLVGHW
ncbi:hypothetical protein Vafri_15480, partial [Volvox africanus]